MGVSCFKMMVSFWFFWQPKRGSKPSKIHTHAKFQSRFSTSSTSMGLASNKTRQNPTTSLPRTGAYAWNPPDPAAWHFRRAVLPRESARAGAQLAGMAFRNNEGSHAKKRSTAHETHKRKTNNIIETTTNKHKEEQT